VMLRHSRAMADTLLAKSNVDDAGRVQEAYERALTRPPTAAEVDQALTFIAQVEKALPDKVSAAERRAQSWQSFCKALLASNEFIYLN
jgi:hypothetical protein